MSVLIWRNKRVFLALGLALLLSACATHDGFEKNFDGTVEPYGFFSGLWHGFIFPLVFASAVFVFALSLLVYIAVAIYDALHGIPIGEFFNLGDLVNFVGEPNTGPFYYVGFLIGLSNCVGNGNAASQQARVGV